MFVRGLVVALVGASGCAAAEGDRDRPDLLVLGARNVSLYGCPACHEDFLSLFALVARDSPKRQ